MAERPVAGTGHALAGQFGSAIGAAKARIPCRRTRSPSHASAWSGRATRGHRVGIPPGPRPIDRILGPTATAARVARNPLEIQPAGLPTAPSSPGPRAQAGLGRGQELRRQSESGIETGPRSKAAKRAP